MGDVEDDLTPSEVSRLRLPDSWVVVDTREPSAMRHVHSLLLEALVAVDDFLCRHGIEYWLTGGALLGAYRGGELLPWDDDIDIGMRRESFDALCRVTRRHRPEGLSWRTPEVDPRMPGFVPGCFGIEGTAALTPNKIGPLVREPGLALDVWPFDELPPASVGRSLDRLVRREHYVAESYRLDLLASAQRRRGRLHEFVLRRTTPRQWSSVMQWLRRWGRGSGLWAYGAETGWELSDTSREMFVPVSTIALHGREYPCPHRTELYLEAKYGAGFRRPPAPESRRPHNRFLALAR